MWVKKTEYCPHYYSARLELPSYILLYGMCDQYSRKHREKFITQTLVYASLPPHYMATNATENTLRELSGRCFYIFLLSLSTVIDTIWTQTQGGITTAEKPTTYTGTARVSVLTLAFDTAMTVDRGVRRGEGCILPQHKSNNNNLLITIMHRQRRL